MKNTRHKNVWVYVLCVIIIFAYILPLYIMGNVSVRVYTDESSWLIPTKEPILDNYIESIEDPLFLNSFKICDVRCKQHIRLYG